MKLRKLLLSAVSALALCGAMAGFAFADTSWTVTFDGSTMNVSGAPNVAETVNNLQPGDSVTFEMTLVNGVNQDASWYMSNEVTKSLEEASNATGGAYGYVLTFTAPDGTEYPIYDSTLYAGEGSEDNMAEATEALADQWVSLGNFGANEKGTVTLVVTLDGVTQNNSYMNTDAVIAFDYAAELVEEPEDNVITKVVDVVKNGVSTLPKTGDIIMQYASILALAAGVAVLVIILLVVRRKKDEEAEE